jgi:ribosomal protein L19E
MTNLRLQKRLASSILNCGKRRIWCVVCCRRRAGVGRHTPRRPVRLRARPSTAAASAAAAAAARARPSLRRLDPNEMSEVSNANSRALVRKLIKGSVVLKKPQKPHSRARVRERAIALAKGRHSGPGKRRGACARASAGGGGAAPLARAVGCCGG